MIGFAAFELKLIAYKIASMAIIVLFADGWLVLLGLTLATGLLILDVSISIGISQSFAIVCPGSPNFDHPVWTCTGLAPPTVSRRQSD